MCHVSSTATRPPRAPRAPRPRGRSARRRRSSSAARWQSAPMGDGTSERASPSIMGDREPTSERAPAGEIMSERAKEIPSEREGERTEISRVSEREREGERTIQGRGVKQGGQQRGDENKPRDAATDTSPGSTRPPGSATSPLHRSRGFAARWISSSSSAGSAGGAPSALRASAAAARRRASSSGSSSRDSGRRTIETAARFLGPTFSTGLGNGPRSRPRIKPPIVAGVPCVCV